MNVVNDYKAYRKYLPEYEPWRDEQDLAKEKRLEYLKQNPDKIKGTDVQRGKILLHAIDVMDEYSQSNAEDMEVATEMATGQVVGLATSLGMLAGMPLMGLKSVKNLAARISKNNVKAGAIVQLIPSVIGMLIGTAASFPAIVWATKAQVSSSRKGRFEAMRKDLSNPAHFAVLNQEQLAKVREDAKSVKLDDKTQKRMKKQQTMGLGNPFDSFKTLKKYYAEDGEYSKQKAEFDKVLKESEGKFGVKLSDKQIQDAKRDQQILAEMVRKIDLASQDYSENTELATNTLTTLALGTGGLVGWASNKLLKLMKVNPANKFAKVVPWAVGLTIPLVMSIYSAKVQKQASRIGRFKARQEMLNNPASLVYVDDKDIEKMDNIKLPPRAKKPNMFQFFGQLIKDHREYNKYRKTKGVEDMKFHKALENIELSEEQLKDAKALQMNVFKTFNKVDEKSQAYSESVEAMGEMTKQGVAMFGSLAGMGLSMMTMFKMLENPEAMKKAGMVKSMMKIMSPFLLFILPVILIDVYTTKAQKKASRVADMLALKELGDYRQYVDYSSNTKSEKIETVAEDKNVQTNLLKRAQA